MPHLRAAHDHATSVDVEKRRQNFAHRRWPVDHNTKSLRGPVDSGHVLLADFHAGCVRGFDLRACGNFDKGAHLT